jgi:hypothetical protein
MGTTDQARLEDQMQAAAGYIRETGDRVGLVGFGWAELLDEHGDLKLLVPFTNLITNWGDQYYATRGFPIMTQLTVTMTANTQADPVVCTTSAAHGLGVGDKVTLSAASQAAMNGTWVITAVTDTTHFTIDIGAVGPATGTATITAIASAAAQTYPPANCMKLGTGSTAMNKTTPTGMDIGTYIAGGNTGTKGFDATYPQFANLGNGLGATATYKTTWNAGEATITGLAEVAICAEHPTSDAGLTSGATKGTVSRALLSPVVNKGASDTLAITWIHKFLGA